MNGAQPSSGNKGVATGYRKQGGEERRIGNNTLGPKAKKAVGRWGEKYVVAQLRQSLTLKYQGESRQVGKGDFRIMKDGREVAKILWLNAGNRDEKGHDIRVIEDHHTTYIEVKSTITNDGEWFTVHRAQWKFAHRYKDDFFIYCVWNAGTDQARILPICDPYRLWQAEQLEASAIEIRP
jgi:hypothetical protein